MSYHEDARKQAIELLNTYYDAREGGSGDDELAASGALADFIVNHFDIKMEYYR